MKKPERAALITSIIGLIIGALIALAGSQNGATLAGFPLFAWAVTAAFAIQIIVFIPSLIFRTEKFFDLTGSLTFISISVGLLWAAPELDARRWVLAAMVILWAARLGLFLFMRIHKAGSDDRFDEFKKSPLLFLRVWVLQGVWVSVTAAAAWIVIAAEPAAASVGADTGAAASVDAFLIIGIIVWLAGIVIEIIADAQKSAFKANPANEGKFIASGLWSRSRHPNYFGEILLWIGVAVAAAPAFVGWQWIGLISPIFVILLLTRVSGIPLLEAKADRKWGGDHDYAAYKKRTPTLIPRLSSPR